MKNLYVLVLLLLFSFQHLFCQWDGNPATVNNAVSTSLKSDEDVVIVSDGAGGAIAAWRGFSLIDSSYSIYVQRKTSEGAIVWQTTGNPVVVDSSVTNYLEISDLVSDAAGGVYITWINYLSDSTSDIYLQHFNSTGTK